MNEKMNKKIARKSEKRGWKWREEPEEGETEGGRARQDAS